MTSEHISLIVQFYGISFKLNASKRWKRETMAILERDIWYYDVSRDFNYRLHNDIVHYDSLLTTLIILTCSQNSISWMKMLKKQTMLCHQQICLNIVTVNMYLMLPIPALEDRRKYWYLKTKQETILRNKFWFFVDVVHHHHKQHKKFISQ